MRLVDVPITGFLFEGNGEDSEHTHKLYITSWNGRPVHVHSFAGVTSRDDGHTHQYARTTESAPSGINHVHGYYTVTSLDVGHTHVIRGTTGPSVPLPGGGHYHYFEGVTTVNGIRPHTHFYRGNTSGEMNPM